MYDDIDEEEDAQKLQQEVWTMVCGHQDIEMCEGGEEIREAGGHQ